MLRLCFTSLRLCGQKGKIGQRKATKKQPKIDRRQTKSNGSHRFQWIFLCAWHSVPVNQNRYAPCSQIFSVFIAAGNFGVSYFIVAGLLITTGIFPFVLKRKDALTKESEASNVIKDIEKS